MKNGEVLQKLLTLTEENTRMKAALTMLKIQRDKRVEKDSSYVLEIEEANEILSIAGMADKEVTAIYFDNCEDKAYVS